MDALRYHLPLGRPADAPGHHDHPLGRDRVPGLRGELAGGAVLSRLQLGMHFLERVERGRGVERGGAGGGECAHGGGAALEAALQALVAFVYNEIKTLISDAVCPIQIALSNVFSNVLQTINTMLIAVENNQPMTETEAAPSWEEAVLPFLIVVTIATMAMVALTVVQDVSLGAGFLVGILGTVIVGTAPPILALSNSLMSQLLSGGSAAILAMMGFVNSTASAEHNGLLFVSPSQGDAGSCYHTVKAFADGFGGQSKKTIIHPRNS